MWRGADEIPRRVAQGTVRAHVVGRSQALYNDSGILKPVKDFHVAGLNDGIGRFIRPKGTYLARSNGYRNASALWNLVLRGSRGKISPRAEHNSNAIYLSYSGA